VCAGHRQGYKKGVGRVGERRGRETQRRAERAELTGLAHGAEREKRDARGNDSMTGDLDPRDREREGARGRRKPAPTDRPHWAVSERKRARVRDWRRQAGSACQGRQARVGLGLVGWFGPKWLFLFPGFSNSFSISFSIGFSNLNSN
jgi:hypothetical protein